MALAGHSLRCVRLLRRTPEELEQHLNGSINWAFRGRVGGYLIGWFEFAHQRTLGSTPPLKICKRTRLRDLQPMFMSNSAAGYNSSTGSANISSDIVRTRMLKQLSARTD